MTDNQPTIPHCTAETMRTALESIEEIRANAIAEARRNYTRDAHTAIRTLHRQTSAHAQRYLDNASTITPAYDDDMVRYATDYTNIISTLTEIYIDDVHAATVTYHTDIETIRKMRADSHAAYGN